MLRTRLLLMSLWVSTLCAGVIDVPACEGVAWGTFGYDTLIAVLIIIGVAIETFFGRRLKAACPPHARLDLWITLFYTGAFAYLSAYVFVLKTPGDPTILSVATLVILSLLIIPHVVLISVIITLAFLSHILLRGKWRDGALKVPALINVIRKILSGIILIALCGVVILMLVGCFFWLSCSSCSSACSMPSALASTVTQ